MKKTCFAIVGVLLSVSAAHADNTALEPVRGEVAAKLIQIFKDAGVQHSPYNTKEFGVYDLSCKAGHIVRADDADNFPATCTFEENIPGPPHTNIILHKSYSLQNEKAEVLIALLDESKVKKETRAGLSFYSVLNLTCETGDSSTSGVMDPQCTFVVENN